MRSIRSGLVALACGLALAACSAGEVPEAGLIPSDEAIEQHLSQRLKELAGIPYPDARLEALRMSPDRRTVCGWLVTPGEVPMVFTSVDRSPETLERPLWIPFLGDAGDWGDPRNDRSQATIREMCTRMGLLAEAPTTVG